MLRTLLVGVALLGSQPAFAGTIVMWEAAGELTRSINYFSQPPAPFPPIPTAPPVGTPYRMQLSFDRDAQVPTLSAPGGANCLMAPATGNLQLGDSSYALTGSVFTNAFLPNSNCNVPASPFHPANDIEFFMFPDQADPTEWQINGGFILAAYWDLLYQDGTLPVSPTVGPPGTEFFIKTFFFEVEGPFVPRAITEQPTPVPEPGTIALLGIGLAYAGRRKLRASRAGKQPLDR